jgi:hypothetical protein
MSIHDFRRHGWSLLALALAALVAGCGKHHAGRGTAAQLRQIRLMTAPDSANRTCYVVAEVTNAGQQPVRKAQVTATLMSAGGKPRGINHCFLTDLQPGEHRVFSMTVEAQGSFRDVQLSFRDPDKK